jgi:hypothetical protein
MRGAQKEHHLLAKYYRLGDEIRVAELCREHCIYTRTLIHKLRSALQTIEISP